MGNVSVWNSGTFQLVYDSVTSLKCTRFVFSAFFFLFFLNFYLHVVYIHLDTTFYLNVCTGIWFRYGITVASVCWFLDNDTKQVRCWASSYFAFALDFFIFNKISCAQRLWVSDSHSNTKDWGCLNCTSTALVWFGSVLVCGWVLLSAFSSSWSCEGT